MGMNLNAGFYFEGTLEATGTLNVWQDAARKVVAEVGCVDGGLEKGRLECTASIRLLSQALGEDLLEWELERDPDYLKEVAQSALWGRPPIEKLWAFASAKVFLETCVKNNFGMFIS